MKGRYSPADCITAVTDFNLLRWRFRAVAQEDGQGAH
jgi:hypothetical protein